jgi:hypothetical protein
MRPMIAASFGHSMNAGITVSAMAKSDPTKDPEFKRVLGNLLRTPPKPHAEMKIGKKPKKNGDTKKMRNKGK